jgi:hypothetical protein
MKVNAVEYIQELNRQVSILYSFAKRMNELDFAVSLAGEFRGAQDPCWATTLTAFEVCEELVAHSLKRKGGRSKAEFRIVLLLYCQLAEAGGVYEALKNILGVVTLKPNLLWPFQEIVRKRKHRIIGPNANSTFRDLAAQANAIGMTKLSDHHQTLKLGDARKGFCRPRASALG